MIRAKNWAAYQAEHSKYDIATEIIGTRDISIDAPDKKAGAGEAGTTTTTKTMTSAARTVRALLAYGPDMMARNKLGQTVVEMARSDELRSLLATACRKPGRGCAGIDADAGNA